MSSRRGAYTGNCVTVPQSFGLSNHRSVGANRKSAMNQGTELSSEVYFVCVRSILDEGWVRALQVNPIATHRHYSGPPRTILTLRLADQSEMLGLLNRLHNMGLTLLSVKRCRPTARSPRAHIRQSLE